MKLLLLNHFGSAELIMNAEKSHLFKATQNFIKRTDRFTISITNNGNQNAHIRSRKMQFVIKIHCFSLFSCTGMCY